MTSLWDPVETTGLPDDLDFTISEARFGYDAGYNNGEQILFIITAAQTTAEGDQIHNFYSLGRAGAWETLDHGKTVVSQADPPAAGFNKQSAYWRFIEAALGTGAPIQERGTPDNAGIWEGFTFHMKRTEVDYGGEIGKKSMLLPTAFIGDTGKADTTAPAAPAVTEVAPVGDGAAVASLLEQKVRALAKVSADHDSFVEAVFEKLPEVQTDEDLLGKVLVDAGWAYKS